MNKEETGKKMIANSQPSEEKFTQLAKKVRRRRWIGAVILIVSVCIVTVGILNYKEARLSVKPPITLLKQGINNGQTITRVCYSLGFKQVTYASEYGRNYSRILWPWEEVYPNPEELTPLQYDQLMEQMKSQYEKKHPNRSVTKDYFNTFQTFEAAILEVEKNGNQYRIYMTGMLYSFFEYGDSVYTGIQGEPESQADENRENQHQPFIVTADWDGKNMKIKELEEFQLGDGESAGIWEKFPEPAAVKINTSLKGEENIKKWAAERSKQKAAAHFGKTIAESTYVAFDSDTKKLQLYQIVPDIWDAKEGRVPQENDKLIKEEKLKKEE